MQHLALIYGDESRWATLPPDRDFLEDRLAEVAGT